MSGMTGEALPVERHSCLSTTKETALNHGNICLMVGLNCWSCRRLIRDIKMLCCSEKSSLCAASIPVNSSNLRVQASILQEN